MSFADITEQILLFFTSGLITGIVLGRVLQLINSFKNN